MNLDDETELKLLVASIEAASKHARTLLFVLLVSAFYVLIAAYAGTLADQLKLPVLDVTVGTNAFYGVSPVILLAIYAYLHIYVAELRTRLQAFDAFGVRCGHVSDPRLLLFPWLLTFATETAAGTEGGADAEPQRKGPGLFVRLVSWSATTLLGPAVLFLLWYRFVSREDAVSLAPCLCFILACVSYSPAKRPGILLWVLRGLLGLALLVVTVASVPGYRAALHLDQVWAAFVSAASGSGDRLRDFLAPVVIGMTVGAGLGGILDSVMTQEAKDRLEAWLAQHRLRPPLPAFVLFTMQALFGEIGFVAGIMVSLFVGALH